MRNISLQSTGQSVVVSIASVGPIHVHPCGEKMNVDHYLTHKKSILGEH
jgi:hypothetical protein